MKNKINFIILGFVLIGLFLVSGCIEEKESIQICTEWVEIHECYNEVRGLNNYYIDDCCVDYSINELNYKIVDGDIKVYLLENTEKLDDSLDGQYIQNNNIYQLLFDNNGFESEVIFSENYYKNYGWLCIMRSNTLASHIVIGNKSLRLSQRCYGEWNKYKTQEYCERRYVCKGVENKNV